MTSRKKVEAYRMLIADVYELAGLSRRVSEREAAAEGATVARWHVLSVASDERMSVPDIARRLGLVRQGVQRVVDELVAEGLLVREPNPAHARSPVVFVTDTGRTLLDRLWAASERSRRQALVAADLDDETLRQVRCALRQLTEALRQLDRQTSGGGGIG